MEQTQPTMYDRVMALMDDIAREQDAQGNDYTPEWVAAVAMRRYAEETR